MLTNSETDQSDQRNLIAYSLFHFSFSVRTGGYWIRYVTKPKTKNQFSICSSDDKDAPKVRTKKMESISSQTRPKRLHNTRLLIQAPCTSAIAPCHTSPSRLTSCARHSRTPTSPRSFGFCAIWDSIRFLKCMHPFQATAAWGHRFN